MQIFLHLFFLLFSPAEQRCDIHRPSSIFYLIKDEAENLRRLHDEIIHLLRRVLHRLRRLGDIAQDEDELVHDHAEKDRDQTKASGQGEIEKISRSSKHDQILGSRS